MGLEGREGLALVNGTAFMTGSASLVVEDFGYLFDLACRQIAVLFQCLQGIEDVFDEQYHALKRHPAQSDMAARLRELLAGSQMLRNIEDMTSQGTSAEDGDKEKLGTEQIQDRYSMRCLAQELGPVAHRLADAKRVVTDELNSVSDNPVLVDGIIKHGGHFDGAFIGDAMDCLKISIRRLAYIMRGYMRAITDAKLNRGLFPTYLVANDPGLNNGLQAMVGLSFDAAFLRLVKESSPDSVLAMNDHEATNQDVVSLGMHTATSATFMIDRLTTLSAMLCIIVRQAVEMAGIADRLSPASRAFHEGLAERIPFVGEDRPLHGDLRVLEQAIVRHEL